MSYLVSAIAQAQTGPSIADKLRNLPAGIVDEKSIRAGEKVKSGTGVESLRPPELYGSLPKNNTDRSFTHLRYTSVEGPATKFVSNGYKLRCSSNDIRVLICVSMYAEKGKEMDFTLREGICKNLSNFKNAGVSTRPITWENIAVVIISDGRLKADKSAYQYASDRGFYDERMLHRYKTDKVSLHLFEYTSIMKGEVGNTFHPPLQTIYAIKENNGGKLDSHFWFFNAFCESVNPEYTFLIDVGTRPDPYAIVRLYACMERNQQIGGCCGEIAVSNPNYINIVEAAQHFEYKTSNFMGKCFESLFGFIAVLPGAFSAYRFEAIRGQPLQRYFYSMNHTLSPFKANMYLAEDRILCLELLAKQGCNWILHYVKDAPAITDVPETVTALIKQRRRWLNGSFFAQLYSVGHFGRVWTESSHSFLRKIFLTIEFFYFLLTSIFTWLQVANFYVVFRILLDNAFNTSLFINLNTAYKISGQPWPYFLNDLLQGIYIFALVVQMIISLRSKPEDVVMIHTFSMIIFGLFGYLMIGLIAYVMYSSTVIALWLKLATLTIFVSPIIAGFVHMEIFPIFLTIIQYYFFMPTYVNVFSIYSLCNVHDVSWGTKGIETEHVIGHNDEDKLAKELANLNAEDRAIRMEKEKAKKAETAKKEADLRESQFKTYSVYFLIFWMLCNLIYVGGISQFTESQTIYSVVLLIGAGFQQGALLVGSLLFAMEFYVSKTFYGLAYIFSCMCCEKRERHNERSPAVKRNSLNANQGGGGNYMTASIPIKKVESPLRGRINSPNKRMQANV